MITSTRSGVPRIVASKSPLGKNTAAQIGKIIARLIDPNSYTGHCFRRTGTTFCADSGMSLAEIKAFTGHRSDTVVQKYIDHSMIQKETASRSVCLKRSQEEISQEVDVDKWVGGFVLSGNVTINICGKNENGK